MLIEKLERREDEMERKMIGKGRWKLLEREMKAIEKNEVEEEERMESTREKDKLGK